MLEKLQPGDNLIVSELSRLGRSMLECMEILSIASERKINIYAVKGNWQLDQSIQSKILAMAFAMAAEDELEKLADSLIQQASIDETAWQWAYLDERHVEYKRRLRPILRALTFEAMSADMPLLNAIRFVQEALRDRRHINFQGRYNFRQTSLAPDIDELVEKLKLYPISLIEPLD